MFVLYNTLHLTVLARRTQVEIMNRLGAGDPFIATPFLIEAVLQTLVAALVALLVVFSAQQALAQRMADVTFLPIAWSVAFVGGAVLLAWAASAVALTRILRTTGS